MRKQLGTGSTMQESTSPTYVRLDDTTSGWFLNGKFYSAGPIRGGADDAEEDSGDEDEGGGGGTAGSGKNLLDQDSVSRIATREKREGKKAGQREVLEALGFESLDDALGTVEQARQREEKEKDEQTRRTEAAEKAQREAETAAATASREAHEARVMKALLKTGADAETVDDLIPMVRAEVGAEPDDIAESVSSLRTKFPALFEVKSEDDSDGEDDEDSDTGSGTPDSSPGKGKLGEKKSGTAEDRAKARLKERHPELLASQQSSSS